jgi:hypothetical protein
MKDRNVEEGIRLEKNCSITILWEYEGAVLAQDKIQLWTFLVGVLVEERE